MNPHHYRSPLIQVLRRGPDVKAQAILALWGPWCRIILPCRPAAGTELRRIAHASPYRRWLRCPPAQVANWRGCIGNALECQHSMFIARDAAYNTCLNTHLWPDDISAQVFDFGGCSDHVEVHVFVHGTFLSIK